LPKENRLHTKADFDRVYKRGQKIKIGPFLFYCLRSGSSDFRAAFVVSRKVNSKANRRNYFKRVLRACSLGLLKPRLFGYDVIVLLLADPQKNQKEGTRRSLTESFSQSCGDLLRRIGA